MLSDLSTRHKKHFEKNGKMFFRDHADFPIFCQAFLDLEKF